MKRNNATREVTILHIAPPGLGNQGCNFGGTRPVKDRLRQVVIGNIVRGSKARNQRHQVLEVQRVARAQERRCRRRKLADKQTPTRTRHARHLFQGALRIGNISQSVGNCDRVKSIVRKGKVHGIALNEINLGVTGASHFNHSSREVTRDNSSTTARDRYR